VCVCVCVCVGTCYVTSPADLSSELAYKSIVSDHANTNESGTAERGEGGVGGGKRGGGNTVGAPVGLLFPLHGWATGPHQGLLG
jgi:hypothetical protein